MTARAVSVLFASTIAIAVAVNYQNSEILSSKYKFFWTYNTTEENLYFKVEVDASGWVGLGFSDTNSGMANMDCIVGGVFAGTLGYLNVSRNTYGAFFRIYNGIILFRSSVVGELKVP